MFRKNHPVVLRFHVNPLASAMLRLCSAVSGELVATLEVEEVNGYSVKALKRRVAKEIGVGRFRQRWFEDQQELDDDYTLMSSKDVELVVLNLAAAKDEEVKKLMSFAAENRPAELERLLKQPLPPDAADGAGNTALHVAARAGHVECVDLLLEAGALPDGGPGATTPLYAAVAHGHIEVVQLLLQAAANLEIMMDDGSTALHAAAAGGVLKVLRVLLEAGSDKDRLIADGDLITALHMAAANGHLEVLELLVEARADTTVGRGAADGTALHWAAEMGHVECVELLLKSGMNFEDVTSHGATALHWAAEKGQQQVVELLLEAGADKDKATTLGATAWNLAIEHGHLEVAQLLGEMLGNEHPGRLI